MSGPSFEARRDHRQKTRSTEQYGVRSRDPHATPAGLLSSKRCLEMVLTSAMHLQSTSIVATMPRSVGTDHVFKKEP